MGPYTKGELSSLVARGELRPDTMVWAEGMPDWVPFSQVADEWSKPTPSPSVTQSANVGQAPSMEQRASSQKSDMKMIFAAVAVLVVLGVLLIVKAVSYLGEKSDELVEMVDVELVESLVMEVDGHLSKSEEYYRQAAYGFALDHFDKGRKAMSAYLGKESEAAPNQYAGMQEWWKKRLNAFYKIQEEQFKKLLKDFEQDRVPYETIDKHLTRLKEMGEKPLLQLMKQARPQLMQKRLELAERTVRVLVTGDAYFRKELISLFERKWPKGEKQLRLVFVEPWNDQEEDITWLTLFINLEVTSDNYNDAVTREVLLSLPKQIDIEVEVAKGDEENKSNWDDLKFEPVKTKLPEQVELGRTEEANKDLEKEYRKRLKTQLTNHFLSKVWKFKPGGKIAVKATATSSEDKGPVAVKEKVLAEKPKPIVAETVELGGRLVDVSIVGRGEALAFALAEPARLKFYDLSAGRFVKSIRLPFEGDAYRMTSSREFVYLYDRAKNHLIVYKLADLLGEGAPQALLRRDFSDYPLEAIEAAWNADHAPIVGISKKRLFLLSADKLEVEKSMLSDKDNKRLMQWLSSSSGHSLRFSGDGSALVCWSKGADGAGLYVMDFRTQPITLYSNEDVTGFLSPSYDAKYLCTEKKGYYLLKNLRPIGTGGLENQWGSLVTSVSDSFFVSVKGEKVADISIYRATDFRKALHAFSAEEMKWEQRNANEGSDVIGDLRYLYFPALQLMVTIPFENDRFVLRKF